MRTSFYIQYNLQILLNPPENSTFFFLNTFFSHFSSFRDLLCTVLIKYRTLLKRVLLLIFRSRRKCILRYFFFVFREFTQYKSSTLLVFSFSQIHISFTDYTVLWCTFGLRMNKISQLAPFITIYFYCVNITLGPDLWT